MEQVPRMDESEARRKVQAGEALLICAYADEAKCRSMRLDGTITLSELQARLPSLPKNQTLIFYCA